MSRPRPQTTRTILALPLLLAALALAGLVLGLTGDGWRDVLSVALLALPCALFVIHWRRRTRRVP
ncbi:hypothetical protein [Novosphingobium sp.]|uniref:hypothetical protein n=1 Tax=Novosphingobium sp. TaxID=1874826 RepID=UPI002620666C|nr:hypothetical protein [Novosphingobium sp.]